MRYPSVRGVACSKRCWHIIDEIKWMTDELDTHLIGVWMYKEPLEGYEPWDGIESFQLRFQQGIINIEGAHHRQDMSLGRGLRPAGRDIVQLEDLVVARSEARLE